MRSNNPVFNNSAAFNGQGARYATFDATMSDRQLQEMYDAPAATPLQTRRLTLDDVVMKTVAMFAVLLVTAALAWVAVPETGMALPLVGMIGGLVLGLVITFKQVTNPVAHLAYAALEGLLVGGISRYYQDYVAASGSDANIVGQAVLGTLAAFVSMLVLYRTGIIKASPKFTKMLVTAMGAYLIIALASFVAAMFGVGDGWGFRTGGLGLLLCAAGVALASFSLILDFDFIEKAVKNGAPERTAWLCAFGLVVTLVWLYLELLRLLAILQGRD
jgi:uncharacterized YccA/Bax inhibitor family protein